MNDEAKGVPDNTDYLGDKAVPPVDPEYEKFKVENPRRLKSWEMIAKREILRWLNEDGYADEIMRTTLSKDENQPGPFTCFLYHFAFQCQAGWGVMVDFNEYSQRVHLCDHYYRWMHILRDELNAIEP